MLALIIALLLLPTVVFAQGPGFFIAAPSTGRATCNAITSPITNQTWCADGNNNPNFTWKVWDGTQFVTITGGGGGTPGGPLTSIQFHDTGDVFGGNAGFIFDKTNIRVGLGSATPLAPLDIHSNPGTNAAAQVSGLKIDVSTTPNNPNPQSGDFVALYSRMESTVARNRVWGANFVTDVPTDITGGGAAWGLEVDVNASFADAPPPFTFGHVIGIEAASGGSKAPSTAFATESTTSANRFQNGFWLEGIGGKTDSIGMYWGTSSLMKYGIFFADGTLSGAGGAIRIPNNQALVWRDFAGSADLPVLYVGPNNSTVIGMGSANVVSNTVGDLIVSDFTGDTAGRLTFYEQPSAHNPAAPHFVRFHAPASVATSYTCTLPPDFGTPGQVLQTDGANPCTLTWVSGGGTGTVTHTGTLTLHAPVVGNGGVDIKTIAALTNGQLAIGSTGADPVPATITAGTGISVTNGAGSITIAATGGTGTVTGTGTTNTVTKFTNGAGGVIGDSSITDNGTTVTVLGQLAITASAITTGAGQTMAFTGATSGAATFKAPATVTTPYTCAWPVNPGNNGDFLTTDGANPCQMSWSAGSGASGITSLNGLSAAVQTFAFSGGTAASFVSAVATHTFTWAGTSGGIPYFSAANALSSSGVLTNHALVIGGGAGATPKTIAAMTNGQLPIGSTGADPVPATITAGTGISVTNGAGSITIAATGGTGTVTGTGTTSTLPQWTNGPGGVLGDSIVSQTANTVILSVGSGSAQTIRADTGGTFGTALTVKAGDATSGNGGQLILEGGLPSGSNTGGSVQIFGRDGTPAGIVRMQGGISAVGQGGNAEVTGGNSASGIGGDVSITGGNGTAARGGNVTLTPGTGTPGGNVIINGLKYPLVDGTAGQVVTTNGAGVLSFTSVSGGNVTGTGTANLLTLWTGTTTVGSLANGVGVLHAGTPPSWALVNLATETTGILSVTHGGTGLASGTSGGVPYFSSATTIASSGQLVNTHIVLGGGPFGPRTMPKLLDGQLPIGSTAGDPVNAFLTCSGGITCTPGSGSINIVGSGTTALGIQTSTFAGLGPSTTIGSVRYVTDTNLPHGLFFDSGPTPGGAGTTGQWYKQGTVVNANEYGTRTRATIQAAINAAPAGSIVQLECGDYALDGTTITIPKRLTLQGCGEGTRLNSPSGVVITPTATETVSFDGAVSIRDMAIVVGAGGTGIVNGPASTTRGNIFDNLTILGGSVGIDIQTNSSNNTISNSRFAGQTIYNVKLANAATCEGGDNSILNSLFFPLANGTSGAIYNAVGGLRIVASKVFADAFAGTPVRYGLRHEAQCSTEVHISASEIDAPKEGISFGACSPGAGGSCFATVTVVGNFIRSIEKSISVVGTGVTPPFRAFARFTITGNAIEGITTNTINVNLEQVIQATITGNTFAPVAGGRVLRLKDVLGVTWDGNQILTADAVTNPFLFVSGLDRVTINQPLADLAGGFIFTLANLPTAAGLEGSVMQCSNCKNPGDAGFAAGVCSTVAPATGNNARRLNNSWICS